MFLTQVLEQLKTSKLAFIAEIRNVRAHTDKGVSSKTGKPYEMPRIIYNLEIGGKAFEFSEELPKGTNPDTYPLPQLKKGDLAYVTIDLVTTDKPGLWRVRLLKAEAITSEAKPLAK